MRALFDVIHQRGLSAKLDVSPACGIGNVSLSNYKLGKNTPSILAVEEIAAALGMRIVVTPIASVLSADTGRTADDQAE